MNALGVGESVEFSLLRYDYAVSCRQRLQLVTPKRFTSTIDQNTGVVIITRLEDKPE